MKRFIFSLISILLILIGCKAPNDDVVAKTIEEVWGTFKGKEVRLITLANAKGMELKVTNYGATIVSILAPDKNNKFENVVIGFDSLQNYVGDWGNHGKTIGRYANRIGGAQFTLNGKTFKLTANNGSNTLHGGLNGFSNQVFEIDSVYAKGDSAIAAFHYFSPDMDEGFPGNLTLFVNFILTENNEVRIAYKAKTDRPTVVNFTNHSYFNLTGNQGEVTGHELRISADSVTETKPGGLPTGLLIPINGTFYDFTKRHKLKQNLDEAPHGMLDINYVLNKKENELGLAAEVFDPVNGRFLEAYTTEPGMQLFAINGPMGKAVCLEMQHFPDSPNNSDFPNVILNPGETYTQTTIYKFSVISAE